MNTGTHKGRGRKQVFFGSPPPYQGWLLTETDFSVIPEPRPLALSSSHQLQYRTFGTARQANSAVQSHKSDTTGGVTCIP
jgi:hypothetical protein